MTAASFAVQRTLLGLGTANSPLFAGLQTISEANGANVVIRRNSSANNDYSAFLFAVTTSTTTQQKAGLFYRQDTSFGRGDLLIALNNAGDNGNVTPADVVLTIKRDKDVHFAGNARLASGKYYGGTDADSGWQVVGDGRTMDFHRDGSNVARFGVNACFNSMIGLGTSGASPSVWLHRDDSNILALRNGSSPQEFRVEEAFTDASNRSYVRVLAQTGGAFLIESVALGTGVRRAVMLSGANRSVHIASPTVEQIRDVLISHGLMEAA